MLPDFICLWGSSGAGSGGVNSDGPVDEAGLYEDWPAATATTAGCCSTCEPGDSSDKCCDGPKGSREGDDNPQAGLSPVKGGAAAAMGGCEPSGMEAAGGAVTGALPALSPAYHQ